MNDKSENSTNDSTTASNTVLRNTFQITHDINAQMAGFLRMAEEAFRKVRELSISNPVGSNTNHDNEAPYKANQQNSEPSAYHRFP